MKKQEQSRPAKAKKLKLNKETLRDLNAAEQTGNQIKGGREPEKTMNRTKCNEHRCE